ncbi:MAG: polysaccharide biosynthesis protein [Oscillospiraceae bacterium]|nr:polysaccharide biosynthesis protein [Oscillospiraceae bacterium]
MEEKKNKSFIQGAAILAAAVVLCKALGAVYKIPLYNWLGSAGTTTFTVTYNVYSLLLTISTAGIPIALSRLISAAIARGRTKQVARYYNVAMPTFIIIGLICMAVMFIFAKQFANFMGVAEIEQGVRVLAPAVFFSCIVSIFRGYTQGFEDMVPTAVSQVIEVIFKIIVGLTVVYIFMKSGLGVAARSSGAITGAVVGMGLTLPAMVYFKRKTDDKLRLIACEDDYLDSYSGTLKELMKVSIPITASILILNIVLLINTKVIIARLQTGSGFSYDEAMDLEGVRSMAMTFFNLPNAFIVPVTTSVVPAISAALAVNRYKNARSVMESALKLNNLFAMPAGFGMAVLAGPIFNGFFWGNNQLGVKMLFVLGFASYFICLQLITTSMLQASGFERLSLYTLPAGCIIQVIIVYILVGIPKIGIMGATIGTTSCYVIISAINMYIMKRRLECPPRYIRTFLKPLICTLVMGGAAWGVYTVAAKVTGLAETRIGTLALLVATVIVAVVVYAVLVIFTGAISRADLQFIPKGDKIAKLLKIK